MSTQFVYKMKQQRKKSRAGQFIRFICTIKQQLRKSRT